MKKDFVKITGKVVLIVLKYSIKVILFLGILFLEGIFFLGETSTSSIKQTKRKSLYRMPRGYGWIRDPKRFIYNKQYNLKKKILSGKW